MLSKSKRLSKVQFDEVFKKGRVFHSPIFVLKVLEGQKGAKFSVVFSKKTENTAVARNSSRRRVYNVIKKLLTEAHNTKAFVFIAKKSIKNNSLDEIGKEISNLFVKSGVLK